VHVVADFPADAQPSEPAEQGDGLLHDPAVRAEPGSVDGASTGDPRFDALGPDQASVFVVVVAAVGEQHGGPLVRPAGLAAYWWDRGEQGHQLGDVIAVAAGQREGQRDAVAVADDVVFRAGLAAVDRARPGFGPPFKARTCELSITALDQSS
jgi:hypothetical protein